MTRAANSLTKKDLLQKMLDRPKGATLTAICKETGWQAHSARAAISGLRKAGHNVERSRTSGALESCYRIAPPAPAPATGD